MWILEKIYELFENGPTCEINTRENGPTSTSLLSLYTLSHLGLNIWVPQIIIIVVTLFTNHTHMGQINYIKNKNTHIKHNINTKHNKYMCNHIYIDHLPVCTLSQFWWWLKEGTLPKNSTSGLGLRTYCILLMSDILWNRGKSFFWGGG